MKISKTIFSAILMSFILPVLSPAPNLPGEPISMLISGPTYVSVSSQTWRYIALPYVTDGIYEWYVYHTENLLGQGSGGSMNYFDARFLDGGAGEYSVQCELYDSFGLLASGTTTVTAVTLDLDVDSNYDGQINGDDEALETSAGGVVPLGKRVPIRITTQGNLGTVTLSAVAGGDKITVWSAAANGTQIPMNQPLQPGTTYTYYVQGMSTSSEVRDIELRLRNTYGTVNLDDTIKLTVVNVDLAVDSNNDGYIDSDDNEIEDNSGTLGFLICKNDDHDNGYQGLPDCDDEVLENYADTLDCGIMELSLMPSGLPNGSVVELSVNDSSKVRIFRYADPCQPNWYYTPGWGAIIGPSRGSSWTRTLSAAPYPSLEYFLIEGVNPGLVEITVIYKIPNGSGGFIEVSRDKVRTTIIDVEFNKDPVKVGIGANRTSEAPAYPATTPATYPHRLIATITPKDAAGSVTFDSSSVARATVSEVSRTDVGNTKQVILTMTGVAETPAGSPGGDADIRALLDGWVCETTKAIVIKPKTRTHAIGAAVVNNTAVLLGGGDGTRLTTSSMQIVTITIKDQFGNVLHSVYNGQNVVEEKFENITNGGLTPFWVAINVPDREFINGIKLDECGLAGDSVISLNFTPAQIAAWGAGTLMINGKNNLFSLDAITYTTEGDMKLKVDGHAVTPDVHRKIESVPNNHPPAPVSTIDS